MTKLTISFATDLRAPDAPVFEVGQLIIEGESFSNFHWSMDPETQIFEPITQELIRSTPQTFRAAIEIWPAFRARTLAREDDPQTLVDFLCHTFRRSSLFVSHIETPRSETLNSA